MSTLKKVILFLFGIVLVVFGNSTAVNTIFPNAAEKSNETAPSDNNNSNVSATKQNQGNNIESPETKIEPDQTEEATATQ